MQSEALKNYTFIKKLGKGAFGEVMLMEDKKGKLVAVKLISKQQLDEHSLESIAAQIHYMKACESRHIVKLLQKKEDSDFYYIFCEYCSQGDLMKYQSKQPNRTFTVKQTVQILSSVIRGLFYMHDKGILHRDIKTQNILVHKNNNVTLFKLADLGFAKHCEQVDGTILGTEHYMSPEVYSNSHYGFEVDMWAFGVAMFFMLNMEYPFNVNPYVLPTQRPQILCKLAHNFSYKAAVSKTKKKLMEKCIPQLEDLFSRVFQPNPENRINFSEIRDHKLFKEYFPEGGQNSAILYKKNIKFQPRKDGMSMMIRPQSTIIMKKRQVILQQSLIEAEYSRLSFLKQTEIQIKRFSVKVLSIAEIQSLRYLLTKVDFIDSLNPQRLSIKHPNGKWKQFCHSSPFNKLIAKYESEFIESEMNLSDIYTQCSKILKQIKTITPEYELFQDIFQPQFSEQLSGKNLLVIFSNAIRHCYRLFLKKQSIDQAYQKMCIILLVCIVFRKLFPDTQEHLRKYLFRYNETRSNKSQPIDFDQFRIWINVAQIHQLKAIESELTTAYLHPKK